MATPDIHPSATVAAGARIAEGCRIGPGCVVGPEVTLEEGVELVGMVDAVLKTGELGVTDHVYQLGVAQKAVWCGSA